MPLAAGTKLDGYEVLGLLGAGGMGEVYRALDPILKREVAIKILPAFVSRDADRLRRFEQEGQAAAALNHPNVLAVYRFGVFEGAPYLVSELLEGDTLRELLQRSQIPVRKAIDYGVQIADGLAAAHEKGIVHRDLKPENLFVTKDGRVKILDFGLAKLTQPQSNAENSGMTANQVTEPGVVMGTAAYMAPEQVRGIAVDHRADIFAFGTILYEMLAGKRAFHRSTSVETMASILNDDPPAISQIVQTTSPGMQRVVHRCLEKNPEQRFQSASDLAFALEALSDAGSAPARAFTPARSVRLWKTLAWLAAALVLASLAAVAILMTKKQKTAPFEHFSIQRAMDSSHVRKTAISPDGLYLASVVEDPNRAQSLTVHQIPTNSERAILKDEKFHEYVDVLFSPDGSYIYFRAVTQGTDPPDRTDLYRIPLLGGSPERVLETVDATPTFIDGGQRLCFLRVNDAAGTLQFLSASADGGDEHVLASIKASFPPEAACDPSGKRAVIEDELRKVYTLDFASGSEKLLISMEAIGGYMTDIRWRPDGGGLFAISRRGPTFEGQLSFLSYPGGALRQITNDPNSYAGTSLTANAKIIATRQTTLNARFEILSLADPSHLEEHGPEGLRHFSWLDNKTIVASDAASTLRRMDLANDDTTPLNPAKGHWFLQPVACGPDTLISMGGPLDKGAMQIYRMNYDGSHATALTAGPYDVYPACTPDGKWLFYENGQDPAKPVLTRLSLRAGGGAAQTVAVGTRPSLSIDGKFLVNVRRGTPPHIEIYSTESLKKLQSIQLPNDFFSGIAFSADDKSIFYPTMTGPDTTLWKQQLDGAAAVKVANLPGKTLQSIRLSPDGTKLGMILETPQSEAVLLREVQ